MKESNHMPKSAKDFMEAADRYGNPDVATTQKLDSIDLKINGIIKFLSILDSKLTTIINQKRKN